VILALVTASTISRVELPETAHGRIIDNKSESAITSEITPVKTASVKNTEEIVRSYFSDIPIMAEIARCESHFFLFRKNTPSRKGGDGASPISSLPYLRYNTKVWQHKTAPTDALNTQSISVIIT
jgi:hypothetical protein